jgi:hypothetical protein
VHSSVHGNVLLVSGVLTSTLLSVVSLGITLGPTLRRHLPPLSAAIAQLGFAFINMVGFKVELGNYFNVAGDDVSCFTGQKSHKTRIDDYDRKEIIELN